LKPYKYTIEKHVTIHGITYIPMVMYPISHHYEYFWDLHLDKKVVCFDEITARAWIDKAHSLEATLGSSIVYEGDGSKILD